MTGTGEDPTDPRPASTLVLLRESRLGLEVLLTKRPKHLRFMGGAAVFPGGAMAPADTDEGWEELSVVSGEEAARAVDEAGPRRALASFVCALRESFEEVGLLLADGPVEELSRTDADDAGVFLHRCRELGIRLRTDLLVPAGRWVTPLGATVRFDARFFIAEAPTDWVPLPDPREVDGCWWSTPADALAALSSGRLLMAPPTIEMLQKLDGYESIEEVTASLRSDPVGNAGTILSVRLSPLVHAVLAPNPGAMTGPGTNTYIVGSGPTAVIDPAVDDERYLDAVRRAAGRIDQILVTHRHLDHVGGVAALAARAGCPVRAFGEAPAGGVPVSPIHDGERIDIGGCSLLALHTPGHASDHVSFLLEGAASLFAGDNVLGEGTAVIAPPDGNMRAYIQSLTRLRELPIDRIYPGHFRPLDGGRAVIDGYLAHREQRRAAVVTAARTGADTVEAIVACVYSDTPVDLHPIAAHQVLAMLEMLEEDGVVERVEERWQLADVD